MDGDRSIKEIFKSRLVVIAHRGASAYAPENTLASFYKAVEQGANAIECDIHLSKDNVPVVIHDERLDRTTNGKGLVKNFTLKDLKKLSAGYQKRFGKEFINEKIPTFEEVVDIFRGKVAIVVEIKNGPIFYKNIEHKVLEIIEEYDVKDQVMVSAFDHQTVKNIKDLDKDLLTAVIFSGSPVKPTLDCLLANSNALHVEWLYVRPYMIEEAHRDGLLINVWTVNSYNDILRMASMKVNGIISDFPDRVVRARAYMASMGE